MNENIDLTKILKGCPEGTEFYHAAYGRVWFVCIDFKSNHPITLSLHNNHFGNVNLTKKGTISTQYEGECLLFPSKDQRDWSKFERFWDKPKIEKFDVNTLQPFDKVLVRDADFMDWCTCWFSHVGRGVEAGSVICDGMIWDQVIPYNEETKHLLGTKDDCPEYYKWWEK